MEKISEQEKKIVDITILKIARWIETRRLDDDANCLIPDAQQGFNLACEFLSHELRKMREMTAWNKEDGYTTAYSFHKEGGE